ncbi:MAG: glutathione S-transferase family protein [Gammaproteobacteria bacterium]
MPSLFDRLEAEIGPSGYLAGDRFGVADLAAAAVMTAIIRPPEFPYLCPSPGRRSWWSLRASSNAQTSCDLLREALPAWWRAALWFAFAVTPDPQDQWPPSTAAAEGINGRVLIMGLDSGLTFQTHQRPAPISITAATTSNFFIGD